MEKIKEKDLYLIENIEKQTVENHVKTTLNDMYEFDGLLNPDQMEVFTMDIAGVPMTEICKRLQISRHTGISRLNKAKRAVALAKPDSPIAQGREGVQGLIPKGIKAYEKSLNEYIDDDKRPGLAIKTATEVLKGTQVLIPKEERETVKETVETKRVLMLEHLDIAVQMGAVAPDSGQIEGEQGQQGAVDQQPDSVKGLKSSPERPDPTPGEADQGGAHPREIPPSESDCQNEHS